jgi:hypothetical protein
MKINFLKEQAEIGDLITIYLLNKLVKGTIEVLGENHVVVNNKFDLVTIFEESIMGWERPITSLVQEKNIHEVKNYLLNEKDINTSFDISRLNEEEKLDENILEKAIVLEDLENTIINTEHIFEDFDIEDIPWKEHGIPNQGLFKGRNDLINELIKHYKSYDRTTTYVLYGLTRTGKSSILRYLGKSLENETLRSESKVYKLIPFNWDLSEAASAGSAEDMWDVLLKQFTIGKIVKLINDNIVPQDLDFQLTLNGNIKYRSKHWKEIIIHLKKNGYFPVFLIDEFTFIESLYEKKIIDSSFLATIRNFTFSNLACFVFAGTYNLKQLVENPKYGITGQLVNTKEVQVGPISKDAAIDLIDSFDKVQFTDDAIKLIMDLSNKIPYFIQIICKNAAYYSLYIKANKLDCREIEDMSKILVGETDKIVGCEVERIPASTFMNNQIMPSDPKENHALISTICYFNNLDAKSDTVSFVDIQRFWGEKDIPSFRIKLTDAIEDLKAKGVLIEHKDLSHINKFKIGVDLFRRWWFNQHSDIDYELAQLIG